MIVSTVAGMVIEVIISLVANVPLPSVVTVCPFSLSGIVTAVSLPLYLVMVALSPSSV